ncbi:hypothetical protein Pfo_022987 [Paulownia fortunei]|nr:hypothetical protein Pfo_022987 [Paulownia fortunei]
MMAIPPYIFLLLFCLPSIQKTGLLVEADDRLIQIECHNANAPTTCIQCLKSDNRSLNADRYAIATLVIECLGKHAASLAGKVSVLASGIPQYNASKKAYKDCVQLFSRATKELESAGKEIKNADYDSADRCVFSARRCNLECYSKIGKGVSKSEVPSAVNSEMMVFEELSEAAMRIIERF